MFDNGKKKYQCFICGLAFESTKEFSNHIIESHEEGREYILCPLKHCNMPVRDLSSHLRIKHKNIKLPPITSQMKATVWHDFSDKKKRKTRKPKFREGYFLSKKMGKEIHYRSGYECEVYETLENDPDVISYSEEPFSVKYFFEGKQHDYNPDIMVKFVDGKIEIWEIKPSNQTALPKNKAKWVACNEYCLTRAWQFMVLTEMGINKYKKEVKNKLICQQP
jgi:hypothetical protein